MADGRNPVWSREELILALDAYFRSKEKGKVEDRDTVMTVLPAINILAERPVRGYKSVTRKIENFRFLNGEEKSALANGGANDRLVFDEFVSGGVPSPELRREADRIWHEAMASAAAGSQAEPQLPSGTGTPSLPALAAEGFREAVLSEYGRRCCVTGMTGDEVLMSAHLKPWSVCEAAERTDPLNGLCLEWRAARFLQVGYMGLEPDGDGWAVKFSDGLDAVVGDEAWRHLVRPYEGTRIRCAAGFQGPGEKYVEWHDGNVFKPRAYSNSKQHPN